MADRQIFSPGQGTDLSTDKNGYRQKCAELPSPVPAFISSRKAGRKDHEDFWIKMGPRYVYIRYFAVRNEKGDYMGTMEVTQDIRPIQEITGEKGCWRRLHWMGRKRR